MIPIGYPKGYQSRGTMVLSVTERTFTKEVLEAPTPVIAHFWAPWCGLCRIINPLLTRLEIDQADRLKVVKINADESLKLATTYRLTTLPTLIIFAGGKVLHRIEGLQRRDDLQKAIITAIAEQVITNQKQMVGSK